jgi:DNA-binding MarR family transcriptional regulator
MNLNQKQPAPASRASMRISKRDFEELARFRCALGDFMHFSRRATQRAGVSSQQYQMLQILKVRQKSDPVSVGQLATSFNLSHNSAVNMVTRAQRAGLVERRRSPRDRRIVHVELTPKGDRTISTLLGNHLMKWREIRPELARSLRNFRSPARS